MLKKTDENITKYKLLYTVLIILVYLICKDIPLYMIDVSAYMNAGIETEDLLMQTISGDIHGCSIFALGISPFMIASIIVQIISAFRKKEHRAKISPSKTNRLRLTLILIIAVIMAVTQVRELKFIPEGNMLTLVQIVATIEMIAGSMIVIWMCSRNKNYGIGGQSPIILVNILSGMTTMILGHTLMELAIPLVIAIIVIILTIFMDTSELRIPVQRISIHNIYADRNYLAIKLNPIGVTSAMFSTAFFLLPQLLISMLCGLWPENSYLVWLHNNLSLNEAFGIGVYIVILYILSIGFSRVFLNPTEITEQFLKSGDSIQDIHAGTDTKKYLSKTINTMSFISATVMSACLVAPMILQLYGYIDIAYVSLPSMAMMLTGICSNIFREYRAMKDLEAYKPFI